ncbi:Yos1-like protein [Naematelia encephala]|uniref:Yos1-like protein n=1 Tax=Naematelia encephala TaxID=71784 RepID=A0A1Y2B462_9TREE|nr:Yos1-like protein [Naematelia encephala]
MVFNYFGHILYIGLLLTNAIAILNEERFLAKIGWSTRSPTSVNQGFGHAQNPNIYGDAFGSTSGVGAGDGGLSIKSKLVNLIGATRTLMRLPLIVVNVLVILYELALG